MSKNKYFFSITVSILTVLLSCSLFAAAPSKGLSAGMENPGYVEKPKWFKLSFLDMNEDVAEARANKKRVMLYFYQDGCPYCKKLVQDNFGQRDIAMKTRKHFDVIAINMWGDKEVINFKGQETTEKEFSKQLKVMFTPTILILDEKGQVILRINGYYFPDKFRAVLNWAARKMEKKISFREYYHKTGSKRAAHKLHQEKSFLKPPYRLTSKQRGSGKPLLVMFEQKYCRACDELHKDILQRKLTRKAMGAFDVVLVDMWSRDTVITPAGKKTTIAKWAARLNVTNSPSLVFFDKNGKEVFRAEAYLKEFHVRGSMTYVSTGAYKKYPSFQRYLQKVNEDMTKKGIKVDLMR